MLGKYHVYLDGKLLLKYSNIFDSGIIYTHEGGLNGRRIRITVKDKLRLNPFLFDYDVEIDGYSGKELAKREYD